MFWLGAFVLAVTLSFSVTMLYHKPDGYGVFITVFLFGLFLLYMAMAIASHKP